VAARTCASASTDQVGAEPLPSRFEEEMAMARIGVDVGGTFTDLVLEKTDKNDCAKVFVHKVASTPHDQSVGVLRGVLEFAS
jgi:activator of 2-hydroxyglutaryl-CoA dehydratase